MIKNECQQLIDSYISWLRKGISAENISGACEITTPFLDRHNDHLQIYASRSEGKIVLSDDGYILADLRTSGLDLNTSKRKELWNATLNGFGVKSDGKILFIDATERNIGQKVHMLVQAMISINDMFVLAQPRVATFFWEDVSNFFELRGIRASPHVKLTGKTGFDHAIDFLIPKSKSMPERIIQTINSPNKNSVAQYLFVLEDTRDARGNGSDAYAFLNDQDLERPISGDVIEALEAYHVKPAPWSKREEFVEKLAA